MTDNTVPNNKATEKKLKVAIPNIEFRPSEMDAIDEKNWVTVPKKSSANSAEPVKAATDDHNKHQKKSEGMFESVDLSDPSIKSGLNGEDDWEEITPTFGQDGKDAGSLPNTQAGKKGWVGRVLGRK